MLTQNQETWLAALADKGIADNRDSEVRNAQIEIETKISEARKAKLEELNKQASELVAQGLNDFDTKIAPTIASTSDVPYDN